MVHLGLTQNERLLSVKITLFSSAWLYQQTWRRRPTSLRPSINSGFSETAAWIQAKFYGKLHTRHISRQFFFFWQFFTFEILTIFFFVFVNMGQYGSKSFKRYFSHSLTRFQPSFMINMLVMGQYRLLPFLLICQYLQIFNILWHFEILLTQDNMGWIFQNATPTTFFIRSEPNFMRTFPIMVEYRLLLFLAIGQVLKHLWHFEIL